MFNKIFNKKVVVPFFSVLGVIAIFQWIVFPGLTAADTLVNILAGIIAFFTIVYIFYSLGFDTIASNYLKSEGVVGETESKEDADVEKKTCGCGRSSTGYCVGLHRIPKKDWEAGVREIPIKKSKTNKNK